MAQAGPRARGRSGVSRRNERQMLALGRLHFLAAFCPLHRKLPASFLARVFIPAVNADCVRFFQNDKGDVCAALIWARLTEAAGARMVDHNEPPAAAEWAAGDNLWFLDLLAPFGHGRMVARHIARNPPPERFRFARLDARGRVARVIVGDATAPRGQRVSARHIARPGEAG